MSAFAEQRQKIRQALVGAGIPDDSAVLIANILGNSAQEMFHAGRITHDTTPKNLRQVTPELRRQQFHNLDPRHTDPDHRRQRVEPSEQRREHTPQPNVTSDPAPQEVDATFRIAAGPLTEVRGDGETAQVGVRHHVAAQPPGGLPLAMLDVPGNMVIGKAPRPEIGPQDGSARFEIRENNSEVIWNLQLTNRNEYDVVTGIEFVEPTQDSPGGLQVTYSRIKAWDSQKTDVKLIPTTELPVVTEIAENKHGMYGKRKTIPAFSTKVAPHSFFNTYRIGKFTGKWELGTEKIVEQIVPQSSLPVTVWNTTRPIADSTDAEMYVLFAPHITDKVPPEPTPPDTWRTQDTIDDQPRAVNGDGNPWPNPRGDLFGNAKYPDTVPDVKYYAIEIQGSPDCDAFSHLEGKKVEDLHPETYSEHLLQALVHLPKGGGQNGTPPCLAWAGTEVEVLTGASLDPTNGLTFSTAIVTVLKSQSGSGINIPTTECL